MTHGLWPRGLGTAVLHNMNLLLTFFNWGFFLHTEEVLILQPILTFNLFLKVGFNLLTPKIKWPIKKKKKGEEETGRVLVRRQHRLFALTACEPIVLM